MGGESLSTGELGAGGLRGDRSWAVWDEADDTSTGAKRFPDFMSCRARYLDTPPVWGSGPVEITFPDGTRMGTEDAAVGVKLSALVDHAVSLRSLRPAEDTEFYARRGTRPDDFQAYLREVFARTEDEPLPDLGKFPPEMFRYATPPGTFFDAFPLLIVTRASLARLGRAAPGSVFDARRFRPNLLVETGETGETETDETEAGLPELAWVGKRLRVGGAELEVTMECPRCVMTTHGFDELPQDPTIMRTLVREAGGNLGVYARVERAGSVSVGDEVHLV
jgi:hypothetical protein